MPWAVITGRSWTSRCRIWTRCGKVARHAATDGQDPEDLVQETYLRAYAAFGSFRGGNMRGWLAAICLNAARRRRLGKQVSAS
jgi:DNA-directed RNA polymerase specialized sigma24 family protein